MTYRRFEKIRLGSHVKDDDDRIGIVLKKSTNNEKALVRFNDGMTEWVEYFKIEPYGC